MNEAHNQFQEVFDELYALTIHKKMKFLEALMFYFTITSRGIWSDDKPSDAEKVEAFKWLNELPRMKFIVDTDGQIINPGIQGKNDTTNLNSLERATLQFIKKMPRWVPGMCNGKVVATEIVRPLAICLKWETE
jgi:hypothetical protein